MNIRLIAIALSAALASSVAFADGHGGSMTSVGVMKAAIAALGHEATEYSDIQQEPHLVFDSGVAEVENIAVFFDDCNFRGYCEDVTLYANFGTQDVSDQRLNGWNHIGSKNRSKAFKNDDGSVAISLTMSYLPAEDFDANATLTGLFLLEAEVFGAMLGLEE